MSDGEFLRITCHNCGKSLKAPAKAAGRSAKCPSCGAQVQIPAPGTPSEPVVGGEAPPPPPEPATESAPAARPVADPAGDAQPSTADAPPHPPTRRRTTTAERQQMRREAEAALMDKNRLPTVLGAAAGVAVLGAIVWAMVAIHLGYEFRYLTIAIGVGTSLTATRLGGFGLSVAWSCAGLTALAILAGRYFSLDTPSSELIEEARLSERRLRDEYDVNVQMARDYFALGLDLENLTGDQHRQLAQFARSRGLVENPASAFTSVDVKWFAEDHLPRLTYFYRYTPDFESWRAENDPFFGVDTTERSSLVLLIDSLFERWIVTLWALGGVIASFVAVQHETSLARRRAARAKRDAARVA